MGSGLEVFIVFAMFLGLLFVGMPIPFAIIAPALVYLVMHSGIDALKGLGLVSWGSMNGFTLTAVPMFILMAQIIEHSGLSTRVYNGLAKIFARMPGGLLQTNIAGCAIFAATTGSSIATAASISGVALPELVRRNYSRRISAGSLAAGGTLGILVPPSLAMIIYGSFTEVSVAKLFMAGIIPGVTLTAMFMLYIAIHAKLQPSIAPVERAAVSPRELLAAVAQILPITLLIAVTLGSMYFGIVTPTEAGAIGCIMGTLISVIWGDLNWKSFVASVRGAIGVLGNILFIVYSAYVFSYAISRAGVGEEVTSFIVGLHLSRLEFFFAIFLLFTVLGCLIETMGMIVITIPLIFPMLAPYGIDPVWFGIILVLFVELGQISPPIGINLFVIQSLWDGELGDVVMGTIPFHLIMFVLLFMLVIWPELALWLPAHMSAGP
jgi:tripartite ATP-independent transporter DctM subunit